MGYEHQPHEHKLGPAEVMNKIASPQELTGELRSLLAYTESPNPSRLKLAQQLQVLSQRVAAEEDPSDFSHSESREILQNTADKLGGLWVTGGGEWFGDTWRGNIYERSNFGGGTISVSVSASEFKVSGDYRGPGEMEAGIRIFETELAAMNARGFAEAQRALSSLPDVAAAAWDAAVKAATSPASENRQKAALAFHLETGLSAAGSDFDASRSGWTVTVAPFRYTHRDRALLILSADIHVGGLFKEGQKPFKGLVNTFAGKVSKVLKERLIKNPPRRQDIFGTIETVLGKPDFNGSELVVPVEVGFSGSYW